MALDLPDLDPTGKGLPELEDFKPTVDEVGPLDLPFPVPQGWSDDYNY